jgi:parallel beta-helix repeat protein
MKRKVILYLLVLSALYPIYKQSNHLGVNAYYTSIEISGANFVFDIYHLPYHNRFDRLIGNLTAAHNTVHICNESFEFEFFTDALFISQPDRNFTLDEKQLVKDWIDQGDKLLFLSGDSDYGGYYDPFPVNDLLNYIDAQIRLDSTSISDPVFNDGASYRVAATEYGSTPTAISLSEGCDAGIMIHGPCAILGFNGSHYEDLREVTYENVEVIISYSENASSSDSDVSMGPTDLYSVNQTDNGYFPAVVYEKIFTPSGKDCHLVLAGESIFADYKDMYDQITETGAYNGGIHYGQKFVNNIINKLVVSTPRPPAVITILSDADFSSYNLTGSGTETDPFVIKNEVLTSSIIDVGIHINSTTKHVVVQDCHIYGFSTGIEVVDVIPGTVRVSNNLITDSVCGIASYFCENIRINDNRIKYNDIGILVSLSKNNEIFANEIRRNSLYGIMIDDYSDGNLIYHNNFLYNNLEALLGTSQASDNGENNTWYLESSKSGNYWSDWSGNGDYLIDGDANSADIYPLYDPYSSEKNGDDKEETDPFTINLQLIPLVLGLIAISIIVIRKLRK